MWTCNKCGEQIDDELNSCWTCAGDKELASTSASPPTTHRLSMLRRLEVVGMAFLSPWLAAFIQSSVVWLRGIRFYQAEVGNLAEPRLWILFSVEGALTLLALWRFAKDPFWCRVIWLCCVGLWTFLLFQSEGVYK